jgi:hypothetical protein
LATRIGETAPEILSPPARPGCWTSKADAGRPCPMARSARRNRLSPIRRRRRTPTGCATTSRSPAWRVTSRRFATARPAPTARRRCARLPLGRWRGRRWRRSKPITSACSPRPAGAVPASSTCRRWSRCRRRSCGLARTTRPAAPGCARTGAPRRRCASSRLHAATAGRARRLARLQYEFWSADWTPGRRWRACAGAVFDIRPNYADT